MTDSIRILIIEDNQNYLNSLKQALALLDGVEYSDGYGSFEAFRHAAPAAPDCILLDINLPGISGLDALIELKQLFGGSVDLRENERRIYKSTGMSWQDLAIMAAVEKEL